MAAVRHLEFLKFVVYVIVITNTKLFCFLVKISMKSDNRLLSYDQKTDFQYGGRTPS